MGLSPTQWQSLDLRESHRRAPCCSLDHAPVGSDAPILGSSRDALATPPFFQHLPQERQSDVTACHNLFFNFFFQITKLQSDPLPAWEIRIILESPRIPQSDKLFSLEDRSLGLVELLGYKLNV